MEFSPTPGRVFEVGAVLKLKVGDPSPQQLEYCWGPCGQLSCGDRVEKIGAGFSAVALA